MLAGSITLWCATGAAVVFANVTTVNLFLQVPINLSVELQSAKTSEETAATLVKLVETKKPTLVVWQTGTVDEPRPRQEHASFHLARL